MAADVRLISTQKMSVSIRCLFQMKCCRMTFKSCCCLCVISLCIILLLEAMTYQPIRNTYTILMRSSVLRVDKESVRKTVITTKERVPENSDVPCTFALFRTFNEDYGYFPGDGKWFLNTSVPYFQPSICKFRYKRMNRDMVSECLASNGIKSVMTLGDSNAQRYYKALKESVNHKLKCRETRREAITDSGFYPDKKYYQPSGGVHDKGNEWEEFIEVNVRFCKGCGGQQHECKLYSIPNSSVTFEHMSMDMLVDDTVQIHVHRREQIRELRRLWSPTSQETLFKYFLKGRYPDIFLAFLPFNHAKQLPSERFLMDLRYCLGMIRLYFPNTTKLIVMPTFSEFESPRKSKEWVNRTFDDFLAAQKIDRMNHQLFSLIRDDLLDSQSGKFAFLDLLNISSTRLEWSIDGIHMMSVWYYSVVSMLWETICNSIKYDAF